MALLAVVLGYLIAAACLLGATLAIGSAAPHFVEEKHCLRGPYKLAYAAIWVLCAAAGGYATAWIGDRSWAWAEGLAILAMLTAVLWKSPWEARQRGLAHQILLTALTPVGVMLGYSLRF
jgi:hypothetical protein